MHYGPGVYSTSNTKEYWEYFLGGEGSQGVELTTLPPSCAKCHKIWEPQPPNPKGLSRPVTGTALPSI